MSEILGIGVDLCEIDRIEKAIQRQHFIDRVYTEQEAAYFSARGKRSAESAAAMYAAKEAAAKALGTGFSGGIMPEQIEVLHDDAGVPSLILHGEAELCMKRRGGTHMQISLSHEANMAAAFVIMT